MFVCVLSPWQRPKSLPATMNGWCAFRKIFMVATECDMCFWLQFTWICPGRMADCGSWWWPHSFIRPPPPTHNFNVCQSAYITSVMVEQRILDNTWAKAFVLLCVSCWWTVQWTWETDRQTDSRPAMQPAKKKSKFRPETYQLTITTKNQSSFQQITNRQMLTFFDIVNMVSVMARLSDSKFCNTFWVAFQGDREGGALELTSGLWTENDNCKKITFKRNNEIFAIMMALLFQNAGQNNISLSMLSLSPSLWVSGCVFLLVIVTNLLCHFFYLLLSILYEFKPNFAILLLILRTLNLVRN